MLRVHWRNIIIYTCFLNNCELVKWYYSNCEWICLSFFFFFNLCLNVLKSVPCVHIPLSYPLWSLQEQEIRLPCSSNLFSQSFYGALIYLYLCWAPLCAVVGLHAISFFSLSLLSSSLKYFLKIYLFIYLKDRE